MRILLFIFGIASFLLGAAILLYDSYFLQRYGEDVNDVAILQHGEIFDSPTGERPLYTCFPAWSYGVLFVLIAVALRVVFKRRVLLEHG